MNKDTHPYFVPDDTNGSRRQTAAALVGTATENDIPQREVFATRGGFNISERMYEAMGWADEDDQPLERQDGVHAGVVGQTTSVGGDDTGAGERLLGSDQTAKVNITDKGFEGSDPDADEFDNGDVSPAQTEEHDEAGEDYSDWSYPEVKAEVTRRGLETADQKQPTLVAALIADDAEVEGDFEDEDADDAEDDESDDQGL
jgi:hypothetical protein